MKKIFFSIALLFTMSASLSSCLVNRNQHRDGRNYPRDGHRDDDHHDDGHHDDRNH